MSVVILAVLLVAAAWAAVVLLGLPYWIAVLCTVAILLLAVTLVILRVLRARRAARAIEAALRAQADQQLARARPDRQAEIEAMKAEFLRAIAALKTSRLGSRRSADALYALPWYLIIGPPGSGKSTALRNCGLRFPYLSKDGGGVQGVGGTRNCQWWMTNDAVILDTAGRYTTEDSDREEWMAFLEQLERSRPRAPINGVLVAVAITELADAPPAELVAKAREIRARIDETMAKLQMRVPVYLLLTKCDLVPGFVEMFGDLGARERSQIWGFTFPASEAIEHPGDAFAERFDELARGIERRALRRMSEERSQDARASMFVFPQHLEPMRDPLATFVGELFAPSIYAESPIMRGCYLTSGTQEGRPIDRVMQSMASAFGVQPRLAAGPVTPVEAKSYFLGELFTKVVFPDRRLASRSAQRLRRQRLRAHAAGLGLMGLASAMVACPLVAFQDNRALQLETIEAVAEIDEHYAAKQESGDVAPIDIEHLEPLRALERMLAEHQREGAPWRSRMGMYQGDTLHPAVRNLYSTVVREELMVPVVELQRRELRRFAQRYRSTSEPPPQAEQAAANDGLHMLLLLGVPPSGRPDGEPGLTDEERAWLVERIVLEWERPLQLAGDEATRAQMRDVAATYVEILAEEPERSFERDDVLVKEVRRILQRADRTQVILEELLADVQASDLDLRALTNARGALSSAKATIPGRYTRTAWEQQVRDRLYAPEASTMGDEWVLGISAEEHEEQREQRMAQVRSAYFDRYVEAWTGFLDAIDVESPVDLASSLSTLEDLTRGKPTPLQFLCRQVAFHTELLSPPVPEPSAAEGATEAGLEVLEKEAVKEIDRKGRVGRGVARALRDRDGEPAGDDARTAGAWLRTEADVAEAFEGLVGFGCPPAPAVPEGSVPPPVPDAALDEYVDALRQLRVAVKAELEHHTGETHAALVGAAEAASKSVDALLNDHETGGWTPLLHKWMRPPISAVEIAVRRGAGAELSAAWCDEVVRPWRSLAGRYPFDPTGADMPLADFVAFFEPERGQLWTFYAARLAGLIPRRHAGYEIEERGTKARIELDPAVAEFLDRAHDVTTAMFPARADGVRVELEVQVHGAGSGAKEVSHTTLALDGTRIDYDNGPYTWSAVTWPSEAPRAMLAARGRGLKAEIGPFEGPWALFRLLEAGTVSGSATQESFKVEWDLRDQGAGIVKAIVKPRLGDTPFFGVRERGVRFMEVFRHEGLTPPGRFVVGERRCRG